MSAPLEFQPGTIEAAVIAMEQRGGGFAAAIAVAYWRADSGNKARLLSAFADLFASYGAARQTPPGVFWTLCARDGRYVNGCAAEGVAVLVNRPWIAFRFESADEANAKRARYEAILGEELSAQLVRDGVPS